MTRAELLVAAADAWRDALARTKEESRKTAAAVDRFTPHNRLAMERALARLDLSAEEQAAHDLAMADLDAAQAALEKACAEQDAALDRLLAIASGPSDVSP